MDSAPASSSASSTSAAGESTADVCRAFVTGDAATAQAALTQLMLALHAKRAELKDVVTSCGPLLTGEDEAQRRRSVLLLAELLTRLPTLPLVPVAWRTLLTFFCERLKDEPCWKESLLGLSALIKRTGAGGNTVPANALVLRAEDAVQVARAVFDSVNVQSMAQSGRHLALSMLDIIAATHPAALVALGEYAISGVIRCIDGEKDPRNLLITFRLAKFIMSGGVQQPLPAEDGAAAASSFAVPTRVMFPAPLLAAFVEEIFDLTSCYFPITFTPPPNDPVGITSAELRLALRSVLACSGLMSEFVMSLLLEKLESTLVDCKVDALDTMTACVVGGAYAIEQLDPFLSSIGEALKKELLTGASGESVYAAAARTLSALVARLCPDQVGGFPSFHLAPSWSLLLEPLLMELEIELDTSPDSKTARAFASIFQLICATTVNAFTRSMARVFPAHVEAQFYSADLQATQRLALLELINLIIQSAAQKYDLPVPAHPLQPYANSMLSMQGSALVSGSSEQRTVALQGMANLAALPSFLLMQPIAAATAASSSDMTDTDVADAATPAAVASRVLSVDQVRSVVRTLTDRLLSDEHEVVRQHALTGLVQLSCDALYRPLVVECTMPALFNERTKALLPTSDAGPSPDASADAMDMQRQVAASRVATLEDVLDAASALCAAAPLLDHALPHLLAMLQTHFSAVLAGDAGRGAALHLVLGSVAEIVLSNSSSADGRSRLEASADSLFHALIAMLLRGAMSNAGAASAALDARTVHMSVCIVQAITRSAPAAVQQCLVDQTIGLFLDGKTDAFSSGEVAAVANGASFRPFAPSAAIPPSHLQLVPLFTAVLGSYKREWVVVPRMAGILQTLLHFIDSPATAASPSPVSPGAAASAAWISPAQQSAIECVAALVNKLDAADPLLAQFVDSQAATLARIVNDTLDVDARCKAVTLSLWVTKALLMRGHARASEFAKQLIQHLALYSSAPAVAECLARGMGLILHDATNVLSREAHALCGPGQLYKQRFIVQHLPHLLSLFESAPAASAGAAPSVASSVPSSPRFVVLLALAHLLQHVPQKVVMDASTTLIPLLLQSISSPQTELRVATLHTVGILLREDVQGMSSHLSTLVPVLTELLTYKPSMRVRLTALECISHLRRLPYQQLHPHRGRILQALALAADDHKRVVRQAAAKARNQWYLMTE